MVTYVNLKYLAECIFINEYSWNTLPHTNIENIINPQKPQHRILKTKFFSFEIIRALKLQEHSNELSKGI